MYNQDVSLYSMQSEGLENLIINHCIDHVYKIPVSKELLYELKEKIYHNQYKTSYPATKPSYFGVRYGRNSPKISAWGQNISVRDYYGNALLDYYYKVKEQWAHVSRVADIESRPAPKALARHLSHDFHVCPADSHRNWGRQGSFIISVVEYGTFYHRLIPESTEKWSKKSSSTQILAKAELYGM